MNRAMKQTICSWQQVLLSQLLTLAATCAVCVVVEYDKIDKFMMQSAFTILAVMLLQGVAAQRVFGADRLNARREASVGMHMVSYFVGNDLAALFEVTIGAVVWSTVYLSVSHCQQSLMRILSGAWAFIYCIFGLNYVFSVCMTPPAAQMSAVVSSFVAFCFSGVYEPGLAELTGLLGGRGWVVLTLSPIRWFWGYLLTAEAHHITPVVREVATEVFMRKGYDLRYLNECDPGLDLPEAWLRGGGWVNSTVYMLMLGLMFRFLAVVFLLLAVFAHSSGWSRFAGSSNAGVWRLVNKFFLVLVVFYICMFMLAEVWIMVRDKDHFMGGFMNRRNETKDVWATVPNWWQPQVDPARGPSARNDHLGELHPSEASGAVLDWYNNVMRFPDSLT